MQLLQSIFIGWIILLSRVRPHYYEARFEIKPSQPAAGTQRASPIAHTRRILFATHLSHCVTASDGMLRHWNKQPEKAHMKPATIIGIILILLGIVGFAVGGISFTHEKKDVDVGPVQISHKQTSTLPISPILSTISLIAGVGLVVVGSKS
jgi:hypothetical protein